jgi:hypothetical protein
MASINRYARVRQAELTFNRHRYIRFCKHRTTYIIILLTILFCLIVNLHILIFFQINHDQCYARPGSYRIFFAILYLIFYAICPSCIMIAINIATVANIRRSIHPTVSRQEYHFIILVIVHSISNFIFLTFEYSISIEIDEFIISITLLLIFINPGFSFFLYTLTTKSF